MFCSGRCGFTVNSRAVAGISCIRPIAPSRDTAAGEQPDSASMMARTMVASTLGDYLRYTADGSLISETRSVGIRIYKNGDWGSAGGLGQVTHHDRSNSRV
jgi:hypothetical protein